VNAGLGLGFERAETAGERVSNLFGAEFEEVTEGESQPANEAGKDEFATADLAEVSWIFEPGNGLNVAHDGFLLLLGWFSEWRGRRNLRPSHHNPYSA
jgi:hypothetical protein